VKVPSRRLLLVASVVVAGGLVAGTAYAAIPRPATSALVACMNTTNGVVRMVDPARGQSCGRRETVLPTPTAPAPVSESAIRAAVDRAVAQALVGVGTPRGGPAQLNNLDELNGLPCNVGTPDAGVVRIRYGRPQVGSPISMICLSRSTVTTIAPPPATVPPPTIEPPIQPPTTTTPPPPTQPPLSDPVAPPDPGEFPPAPADGAT
jgi:hypothetical protein